MNTSGPKPKTDFEKSSLLYGKPIVFILTNGVENLHIEVANVVLFKMEYLLVFAKKKKMIVVPKAWMDQFNY